MTKGKSKKKGKKSGEKRARKSAKRAAAARKAARTRQAKHEKRVRAARKAARTRARKGKSKSKGKRSQASEPKRSKSKKKGHAKKKGGKKGKRKGGKRGPRGVESLANALRNTKSRLANLDSEYETRLSKYRQRLQVAQGNDRKRLEDAIERLKKQRDAHKEEYAAKAAAQKEKYEELLAAERSRHKGKKKKKKHNPIDGGGEGFAAAAGAGLGGVLTVVQYRAIVSHPLVPTNPAGVAAPAGSFGYDTPAVGDVPNLLAPALPVWSKFKWRKLVALLAYLGIDVGVPFAAVMWVPAEHRKTRTFFQAMLIADLTLGGTKLLVDVAAFALKGTKLGNRLFAPENTARSSRAFSAQQASPQTFLVAPGGANGTLAGYGRALEAGPARNAGAGKPCCAECGKATVATGGCGCKGGQPQNYVPKQPPAPAPAPTPAPTTSVPGQPGAIATGAGEAPRAPVATAGPHAGGSIDTSNVTPIGAHATRRAGAGHTSMRRAFGRR